MPPGNICAVAGCSSKEKEENVSSFTLPKTVDNTSVRTQAGNKPSGVIPTTQTKTETAVTWAITQRPKESSLAVPVSVVESSSTVNTETRKESAPVVAQTATVTVERSDSEESDEESFNKMPLQLTKPAPQFKTTAVVNGEFKDVSLADYKGKYVVLFFYPLDFTFVCPTEIIAFSERADDFRKIGCEVIAASTDSHFTHLAWINTPRKQGGLGPMNIPILADKSHRIARDYGVLDEETGIPFRGLFIIDDAQRLRQITVNDLPVGRSVDETLRLVQAFQYTDKYGEVCPANWTPGSKTIKPDTKAAKEYFGDAN